MSPPGAGGDYNDDDFVDQYDDDLVEEVLSPEDQASMDAGTSEVRYALGSDAVKVTLEQIQDCLWHYYFDVDKSVTYLKKTFIAPPPTPAPAPKKTPDGESETSLFPATACRPAVFLGAIGGPGGQFGRLDRATESLASSGRVPFTGWSNTHSHEMDFSDMPWLNIPKERQTTFIPPRRLPGGLLGGGEGTNKLSKLQALAAARKKKTDEEKGQEKTSQAEKGIKKLSIQESLNKENARPVPPKTKSRKLLVESSAATQSHDTHATSFHPTPVDDNQASEKKGTAPDIPSRDVEMSQDSHSQEDDTEVAVVQKTAPPSAFFQTICERPQIQNSPDLEEDSNSPGKHSNPWDDNPNFLLENPKFWEDPEFLKEYPHFFEENPGFFMFRKSPPDESESTETGSCPTKGPDNMDAPPSANAPGSRKRQRRDSDIIAMPYLFSPFFNPAAFLEPSPDDIVLAAQAKAGKKTPSAPKAAKKAEKGDSVSKKTEVANGMSNLKVADVPPPKSKGLDVVKEFENSTSKRSTSFVVVGHVDAGKSTLMGRLLLELKFVEERTVEKYRRQAEKSGKQSFALAWVMDQRSEERDRGVTIDIATNHFETEKTNFTILDAPGHRDFVPNMIAGASQADFAILVIDANTGAYEKGLKGQTREHVLLLRSLGVQRLIVAVNKLDMVGWSKDRFDEISQQVTGFLTGLGFQVKHISFIPISGLSGGNIATKVEDPAASWYQGATLMDALEASGPSTARALKKPFRMAVSEVFRSQQGTTTLAGRVDSGTMQIGDVVFVQPSGETAYIKSIVVDTEAQEWAVAGQNVSVALTDIDPIHIRVGDIICHTTDPIECGDTFTMKAMAFEHLMPMAVDLHRGRLHAAGQIQSLVASLDKATGDVVKKKPKVVQPGGVARVVIKLGVKVPLERGQRVVIRSGGETVAAGLLE